MSYQIREITDKSEWEAFLTSQAHNSFLQSWNWGELHQSLGSKIFRLGLFAEQLEGILLVIKIVARRGTFFHIPYGPVINWENPLQFKELVEFLKDLAKKEQAIFIRINPLIENSAENQLIFRNQGFREAPVHLINPEISWVKDLDETEEEIMKNFKKNTRYEIKKAEKEGVKVLKATDEEALKRFYEIHMDTVKRQKFVPYSYKFLKNQLEIFAKDNQIVIFEAEYQGKVIASAIVVFYGGEASYHHAASLSEFSRIPAAYLIQWEIIREAKSRGMKRYNFWGIVENQPKHPWAGLSHFKQKFGGYKKEYLHVQDLAINFRYFFNWLVESWRRLIKGY